MFAWRDNFIGFSTAVAPANDPYWTSVSFLQNNESPSTAFTNSSTVNPKLVVNGTPRPNGRTPFASGEGASMYWDGTANWLEMPANAEYSLGTGNFTFEAWVYVTNFSVNFGGYMPIVGWGGGNYKIFRVRPTAMNFQAPNISGDYNANWPSTMVINTWYHVALVRTSTTSARAYLNGVAGTAVTIPSNAQFGNATDVLQVGYKSDPGYWWGYISNWRLVKGTAVYTSNFTPSTSPLTAISGTSALFNFTNPGLHNSNSALVNASTSAIPDYSINSAVVTNTNSVLYSGLSPFTNAYPGSLNFISASSKYLTIPTNAIFTYATGDFTIEGWFRFTSVGTTQYLIDQRNSGTATAIIPTIYLDSTNVIIYYVNGAVRITGTAAITTNTWYHIAVSKASGSTKLFVNGSQDGSTYTDSNSYAASRVVIGSAANTVGSYLNGYASSIRLSKGFAYYTGTFTPSTTPLSVSQTYTSLLINPSMAAFQDLSNTGQLITSTATNNVVSTAQYKFGTQSAAFVATGYETVTDNATLQFGTSDFTIEGWVYRNAAGATHSIISKGAAATGWLLQINTSNQLVWTATSTALKTSTTTIPATTWTYFAIARSGTTGYMFINGTLEGATYSDTTNYNQTNNMYIGADRSVVNGLNGYLDDLRVTTGVCRYTASFSAPTTTFPTS